MPRASIDDMILNFRYQVYILDAVAPSLQSRVPAFPQSSGFNFELISSSNTNAPAGFRSITLPNLYTVDEVEYREGIDGAPKWFPGLPHSETFTLSYGMTYTRTTFWKWLRSYLNGQPFRVHLLVAVFNQHSFVSKNSSLVNVPTLTSAQIDSNDSNHYKQIVFSSPAPVYGRGYIFYEVAPISTKPTDLDASATDVLLEEITARYEYADLILINNNVGTRISV